MFYTNTCSPVKESATIEIVDRVRVDKWLWAARFAKTRSAATDLVLAGHVKVGGERVKPARGGRLRGCPDVHRERQRPPRRPERSGGRRAQTRTPDRGSIRRGHDRDRAHTEGALSRRRRSPVRPRHLAFACRLPR